MDIVVPIGERVDRLRARIRDAVQVEASVEVRPWATKVVIPRPHSRHPGWPALIEALRSEGGRWGNLETAAEGAITWVELREDDDG